MANDQSSKFLSYGMLVFLLRKGMEGGATLGNTVENGSHVTPDLIVSMFWGRLCRKIVFCLGRFFKSRLVALEHFHARFVMS